MRSSVSPLFIVCSLLFLAHQLLQHVLNVIIPLVDAYADPLLAMPIILTILEWEQKILFRKSKDHRLTGLTIVLATLYIAVISELVFPALSPRFVFDWVDIVLYFTGTGLFVIYERRWRVRH